MREIKTIQEIRQGLDELRKTGKTIGYVPMGYLHQGHMSLVQASIAENDVTVMSMSNPTQFGPNEDFEKYPRDAQRDLKMAETEGVDFVFMPSAGEMYPEGYQTTIEVEGPSQVMCGKSRSGHFRGVTTVVGKFFNIIQPDRAYFGQKDAQQVIIIRKMVLDLNMRVDVKTCPIVREQDGLAMSSRNVYLSEENRKAALILSKSLKETEVRIRRGMIDVEEVRQMIRKMIQSEPAADIDYIEIVDAVSLEEKQYLTGSVLIALAVRFGATRLIDNLMIDLP